MIADRRWLIVRIAIVASSRPPRRHE